MTEQEFIKREILLWGEDYIEDLLDKGYKPLLTNKGWKWTQPVSPLHSYLKSVMGLAT